MVMLTLNAVFAAGFATAGVNALRRGWPFLQYGWSLLRLHADAADADENVERRRAISEGGRFVVGGLLWLAASVGAFGFAAYFGIQVIQTLYG